ncbi:MAG: arginyltransferase [Desulfobacteraceae bacterium 4572_88]|nr:MAG: arginyltransferase [Desulfobacteraceae bacterium 4572_88]
MMLKHLNITEYLSQGECQYLEKRKTLSYTFSVEKYMPPEVYESIINKGFRRNGFYFYQNICPNCSSCIPIRMNAREFRPSKSQRRVLRKNQDVRMVRHPVAFEEEGYLLYRKYCSYKHNISETEEDYTEFLIGSPVPTEMTRYYAENQLVGIGWTDVLPNSLSSVYFAFDPDYAHRSPGVFSLLKEMELCRELKKEWLQLGFWISENRKMSYKTRYKPFELLINGVWQAIEN